MQGPYSECAPSLPRPLRGARLHAVIHGERCGANTPHLRAAGARLKQTSSTVRGVDGTAGVATFARPLRVRANGTSAQLRVLAVAPKEGTALVEGMSIRQRKSRSGRCGPNQPDNRGASDTVRSPSASDDKRTRAEYIKRDATHGTDFQHGVSISVTGRGMLQLGVHAARPKTLAEYCLNPTTRQNT